MVITQDVFYMIQNHNSLLDNFRREVDSINESINVQKRQLQECNERLHVPQEFAQFKEKIVSDLVALQKKQENLSGLLVDLARNMDTLKKLLQGHEDLLGKLSLTTDSLPQLIEAYLKENTRRYSEVTSEWSKTFASYRKEIQEKLAAFDQRLSEVPASVINTNTDILQKLDLTSKDASNAMLKVNNVDLGNRILERRIERVELLLKKAQLTQQGT